MEEAKNRAVVPAKYFTECYAVALVLKSHVLNLAARGERYASGVQHDESVVCIVEDWCAIRTF